MPVHRVLYVEDRHIAGLTSVSGVEDPEMPSRALLSYLHVAIVNEKVRSKIFLHSRK